MNVPGDHAQKPGRGQISRGAASAAPFAHVMIGYHESERGACVNQRHVVTAVLLAGLLGGVLVWLITAVGPSKVGEDEIIGAGSERTVAAGRDSEPGANASGRGPNVVGPLKEGSASTSGSGGEGSGGTTSASAGASGKGAGVGGGDQATGEGGPGGRGLRPFEGKGAGQLSVQVVNESGQGMPRMTVTLSATYGDKQAESDNEGRLEFPSLPAGRYSLSVATAEGSKGTSAAINLAEGEAKKVTLRAGAATASIRGRALDSDGNQLPGVKIQLSQGASESEVVDLWPYADQVVRAETDAQGFYELRELPSGSFMITASWQVTGEEKRKQISVPSAAGVDFEFRAALLVVITGVCRDTNEKPVPDVTVMAIASNTVQAQADAGGVFRLEAPWSATMFLRAMKQGYRRQEEVVRLAQGEQERQVDFTLTPALGNAAIEGVLGDQSGKGIEGEAVLLTSAKVKTNMHARSGPDGRFSFSEIEASDDYSLAVFPKKGYKDLRKRDIVVGDGETVRVDLTLEASELGAIDGVLVDAEGKAMPGYAFRVRSAKSWSQEVRVVSGPEGKFTAEDVPAGDIMFDTWAAPHYSVRGVTLEAGERKSVEVVFGAGDGVVEGHVTAQGGSAQPGARVTLSWIKTTGTLTSTVQQTTVADQSGWYRLSGLAHGTYQIEVRNAVGTLKHEQRELKDDATWDFVLDK